MNKQDYRQEMLKKRNELEPSEKILMQNKMKELFVKEVLGKAEVFFLFASYGSEPDTFSLMEECFLINKKVYLPKVMNKKGHMEFFQIKDTCLLSAGCMGIPEPEGRENAKWTDMAFPEKTVMLLPGLCFDRMGHRIGYGGGYYDRYLSRVEEYRNLLTVGFCYSFQIREEIPFEASDYSVDCILSEKDLWEV